jgi:hypothetical protein
MMMMMMEIDDVVMSYDQWHTTVPLLPLTPIAGCGLID